MLVAPHGTTGNRPCTAAPTPDACSTVLHLNTDDTRTLAELLGGSPVSEAVSAVQQQLECGDAVCTQDRLRRLHDLRDA